LSFRFGEPQGFKRCRSIAEGFYGVVILAADATHGRQPPKWDWILPCIPEEIDATPMELVAQFRGRRSIPLWRELSL
jgi:hypothetical protein